MLNNTDKKIAVILRHNVAAARAAMELDDPSPYPLVDLTQFPEEKMHLYLQAVRDLKPTTEGYYMPHEMWFNTHWALFPFAGHWDHLNHDHQVFVEYVHKLCQKLTTTRG